MPTQQPTHVLLSRFIDAETAKHKKDTKHVKGGGLATHSWVEDGKCARNSIIMGLVWGLMKKYAPVFGPWLKSLQVHLSMHLKQCVHIKSFVILIRLATCSARYSTAPSRLVCTRAALIGCPKCLSVDTKW